MKVSWIKYRSKHLITRTDSIETSATQTNYTSSQQSTTIGKTKFEREKKCIAESKREKMATKLLPKTVQLQINIKKYTVLLKVKYNLVNLVRLTFYQTTDFEIGQTCLFCKKKYEEQCMSHSVRAFQAISPPLSIRIFSTFEYENVVNAVIVHDCNFFKSKVSNVLTFSEKNNDHTQSFPQEAEMISQFTSDRQEKKIQLRDDGGNKIL
ncbi:UNVERIFIED_CONTAM: hypothetical protein NCL1_30948 [Trichonephila clavipes]